MPTAVRERTRLRLPALPRAAVVWLVCLASAFAALLICSMCSPLYATNDWIDANAYLTIGRAMLHGQVPYRDLVDHKGPLLYFLHMLAALLQPNGFFGVFLLEIAAGTVFCRWAVKLAALFTDSPAGLLAAPISAALAYSLHAFWKGDSAEEFALPLLLIALYDLVWVMLDEGRPVTRGMLLRNGLLAGVLFWIKYTLLGLHFAFMACLFFELLVFRRQIARAFAACGWFLLGMAAPAVPVLAYFAANRALGSLWEVYFYNNLFRYSDLTGGLFNRLVRVVMLLRQTLVINEELGVAFFVGVALVGLCRRLPVRARLYLGITAGFTALFIWVGGAYWAYYGLPMAAYIPLVPALILPSVKIQNNRWPAWALAVLLCFMWVWVYSPNRVQMAKKKEDLVQTRFAAIINQTPDASILDWGAVDSGFYTAAGLDPQFRYFIHTNAEGPEADQARLEAIRAEEFDYIVIRDFDDWEGELPDNYRILLEHYEIVTTEYQECEEVDRAYTLLARRENG